MPPNDWEYEYNGLTFGGNQIIGVVRVEGLSSPPAYKTDITPRTGAHGSAVFAQFYEERHIIFEGDIVDDSNFETNVDTLRTTFAVRTVDTNLLWKLPGINRRRIACRPVRLAIAMERGYDVGITTWAAELVAADPAIYDDITSAKLFDG